MSDSNTDAKQSQPWLFQKGDPRINRKGRPKSFDKLRSFTLQVLSEPATDGQGEPIVIDGHIATRLEVIVREWLTDTKHQKDLLEVAFGKVPDKHEIAGADGEVLNVIIEHIAFESAGALPGPADNQAGGDQV